MLHEVNVVLKVCFAETPTVGAAERVDAAQLAPGFWRMTLRYGFKEHPDVPAAVARLCAEQRLGLDGAAASYFLGRPLVAARPGGCLLPAPGRKGMSAGRAWVFAALHRNASSAVDFYQIPRTEAIELGAQVLI